MEPHDQLMQLIPGLLFLGIVFFFVHRASERGRLRDRQEHEEWWRRYRENERRTDLQHAWRARFRRYDHESEDEFVERFRSWLYDD